MDGGAAVASTKVQEGVNAAKELAPLAAQYPIAFALLVVVVFAVGCMWIFYRRDVARSEELRAMVDVNRDQAATLEVLSNQLDAVPIILTSLAVMAQVMKLNEGDLAKALAETQAAKEELVRRRRNRNTGAVPVTPPPTGKVGA